MKSGESSATDIISNLPCSVLEKILGRLPWRDAIRTSVLSREWRYKWVVRPEVVFDNKVDQRILKTLIYQVLLIHQGPLRKFSLLVPNSEFFPDIDCWIQFLLKKNVHEVSLKFLKSQNFCLPPHLFKFQDLRTLELLSCKFHPPPNFKAFSRLATVDFSFVTFEPTSFQSLLSSSPLLERATLTWCTPFNSFIVDSPNLKFFEFSGIAKSICFKNTTLLEEVTVGQYSDNLESFTVGLPEPPVILHSIKFLYFKTLAFGRVEWVEYALQLISNCPNLEKLQIICWTYKEPDPVEPAVVHLLRSQGMPHSALKQLKSVDMTVMWFNEAEMEFVKYVLSSAAALKKVCIWTNERHNHLGMKMMEEMKQFRRSSPSVEFMYRVVYTK